MKPRRSVSMWLLLIVLLMPSLAQADAWQCVRDEAGISSWKREGEPLPTYRARATLDASVWDALAVLDDVERACEWTSRCAEMRRVRTEPALIVYARMDAPWPVRDRDVSVRVDVVHGGIGELTVQIRSAPLLPRVEHAVRMPRFDASYRFTTRPDGRTDVEYQLAFDPGGALPDWLKALAAKNLAHDTLHDLRARVRWANERGLYRERSQQLARDAERTGYQRVATP